MHNCLTEYLSRHKDDLAKHYGWAINEAIPRDRFGFTFTGSTPFEKTLELKYQLFEAALTAQRIEEKQALAEYFIKEWGRIRKFSKTRQVVEQFDALAGGSPPAEWEFPFENISSWSKWLSIICPAWAIIYDARVAYSLNAINFLSGAPSKVFPIPSGRNTTMKLLDASTLVLTARLKQSEPRAAKAIKQHHIWRENEVYETYLDTVTRTHQQLWPDGTPITYTEMLLFSLADTVVFNDLVTFITESHARN